MAAAIAGGVGAGGLAILNNLAAGVDILGGGMPQDDNELQAFINLLDEWPVAHKPTFSESKAFFKMLQRECPEEIVAQEVRKGLKKDEKGPGVSRLSVGKTLGVFVSNEILETWRGYNFLERHTAGVIGDDFTELDGLLSRADATRAWHAGCFKTLRNLPLLVRIQVANPAHVPEVVAEAEIPAAMGIAHVPAVVGVPAVGDALVDETNLQLFRRRCNVGLAESLTSNVRDEVEKVKMEARMDRRLQVWQSKLETRCISIVKEQLKGFGKGKGGPKGLGKGFGFGDYEGGPPAKKARIICHDYFKNGVCSYGSDCKFLHSWSKEEEAQYEKRNGKRPPGVSE